MCGVKGHIARKSRRSSVSTASVPYWAASPTFAPAWMRGRGLPGYMMGSSGDPGKVMGALFAEAPGTRVAPARAARLGTQGHARSSWLPMSTASPAFAGSAVWFLGDPTSAGMHAGTLTFTATRAGTYRYLCPVPGHAQEGMAGTFIVSGTS